MLHFHKPEEFKECASGDARDLDVDGALEKASHVFGVFPSTGKGGKGFYIQERCLGKLANGVWQDADIPDCSSSSR